MGGPVIESAEASITSAVPSNSQQSSCSTSATGTSQAEWHLNFVISELRTFSQFVTEAVSTGVVTARARREIVQVLHTYITAHTVYPSSEQYKMVCAKLVTKFTNLKDTKGSKYVSAIHQFLSWIQGIRNIKILTVDKEIQKMIGS